MEIKELYSWRDYLVNQGVSNQAAEAYARLLPLMKDLPIEVDAQRAANYLERSRKSTLRWLHELTRKGFMYRTGKRNWRLMEIQNGKV